MPNRRRPIDMTTPAARLAMGLRALQREAIARAASTAELRAISIDQIAGGSLWRTSKTAIYAALNGTRLPSTDTISALAAAWDPRGEAGRLEWLRLRDAIEDELQANAAAAHPSQPTPTVSPTPQPQQEKPKNEGAERALVELRDRMEEARLRHGLALTQTTARARLGRTTVSQAFRQGAPAPSGGTVMAIGRALAVQEPELKEWLTLLRTAQSRT